MVGKFVVAMSSRRTSRVPKEDVVFPRMLYCESRSSQMLTGLLPALPGVVLCYATRRLGAGQRTILCQRVRGSVRSLIAIQNSRLFQTDASVFVDVSCCDGTPRAAAERIQHKVSRRPAQRSPLVQYWPVL
jgi:hypothetical protein